MSLMAKTDIDSAFRLVPIHPDDHELLGIMWEGQYYFDTCLPFGASSSCAIFERFSSSLQWIAATQFNIRDSIHILDDFLFMGPPSSNSCQSDLSKFLGLCKVIGVPIKKEKTVAPTTCITFMGLELDSASMEARLPYDKLVKVRSLLKEIAKCRKITLRQLQSIIGLLNFCCSVVRPGRCFLRRLIDLTMKVKRAHYKITLNKESRKDLAAWLLFTEEFNGKSLLLSERWITSPSLHLHTDAAGSLGYGAIMNTKWFYGSWPSAIEHLPITYKEMFPIVLAFKVWSEALRNQCITLHCDNYAVVYILNKQTSRDPSIMTLVRQFVVICMINNILIKAVHVPGEKNILPDLLSRFQVQDFKTRAPHMDQDPVKVPDNVIQQLLSG